jgi:uncharacterized membrane protein YgcG
MSTGLEKSDADMTMVTGPIDYPHIDHGGNYMALGSKRRRSEIVDDINAALEIVDEVAQEGDGELVRAVIAGFALKQISEGNYEDDRDDEDQASEEDHERQAAGADREAPDGEEEEPDEELDDEEEEPDDEGAEPEEEPDDEEAEPDDEEAEPEEEPEPPKRRRGRSSSKSGGTSKSSGTRKSSGSGSSGSTGGRSSRAKR